MTSKERENQNKRIELRELFAGKEECFIDNDFVVINVSDLLSSCTRYQVYTLNTILGNILRQNSVHINFDYAKEELLLQFQTDVSELKEKVKTIESLTPDSLKEDGEIRTVIYSFGDKTAVRVFSSNTTDDEINADYLYWLSVEHSTDWEEVDSVYDFDTTILNTLEELEDAIDSSNEFNIVFVKDSQCVAYDSTNEEYYKFSSDLYCKLTMMSDTHY